MNTDPTANEMREHLKSVFKTELDEFDMEGAIYWFANHYHSGQWSNLYSALSTSEFKPGLICNGPESESMEQMAYDELVSKFGQEVNP